MPTLPIPAGRSPRRLRSRNGPRGFPVFPLVALLALLAGGCSPAPAAAPPLVLSTPEAAGMDAAALDAAVDLYREVVEADDLRGVVLLVARSGQVVVYEALGWRDAEAGLPMERGTLFRMASNTKPVIATAALILEQEGRLSMSDPVSRFIPAFAEGDLAKITVHHLATHGSGLPRSPIFLPGVRADSDLRQEAARFAAALEVQREPAAEYEYSNVAYNVLGGVIEAASGRRLEGFLRERIYEPLGMVDSNHHESSADHARMSKIYRRTGGEWQAGWSPGDDPDYPIVRASGGMISTAWDYAIFLQMWLGRGSFGGARILSEESVARATERQLADYGYGWMIGEEGVFSHSGSDGTYAWVDPANGLIGIVFTQSPSGGRNPRAEFARRVAAAITDF